MKSTRKLVPNLNVPFSHGCVRVINIKGALVQWYILKQIGLGIITLAVLCCSTHAKELVPKPNILFIFSDDLSYRDLSSFGQEQFRTPNLDKLAINGIRFTQAYSGASECAPSRASLMTGMHMGCIAVFEQIIQSVDRITC